MLTVSNILRPYVTVSFKLLQCNFSKISDTYNTWIKDSSIKEDLHQRKVIKHFDYLYEEFNQASTQKFKGNNAFKGLYIYGDVGCGKTMLMDLFYESVDFTMKKRLHFHEFMRDVHKKLHIARQNTVDVQYMGLVKKYVDPISRVAKEISEKILLLCFDEFQVTDIADAMILKRLFAEMYDHGVVVVSTSNRHPDDLYKNGLQRINFIPFIDILKKQSKIIYLNSGKDYREINSSSEPPTEEADMHFFVDCFSEVCRNKLENIFLDLVHKENIDKPSTCELFVMGRKLHIKRMGGGVAFCKFTELCSKPLGTADYIAIAEKFHTVIIAEVPLLDFSDMPSLRRFINLIDVLYDEGTRVIMSSEVKIDNIFDFENIKPKEMLFETRQIMDDLKLSDDSSSLFTYEEEKFACMRTVSRLREMRSSTYWLYNGPHVKKID